MPMSKYISGKEHRKEGDRVRLFTVIECSSCHNRIYERKTERIKQALDRECIHCQSKQDDTHFGEFVQDGRCLHPLYSRYQLMMLRCYNPSHKSYPAYGGKGVEVCTRWIVDFWAFVDDLTALAKGSCKGLEMDRIDSDGPYDPRNVRMVSKARNVASKRSNHHMLTSFERDARDKAYRHAYHKKTYKVRPKGWWREEFGLYSNPYVYGPMPWKRTSLKYRKMEAEHGWEAMIYGSPRANRGSCTRS